MITMRWTRGGRVVVIEDGAFYEILKYESETEPGVKCDLSEIANTAGTALREAQAQFDRLERERQRQDVIVIGT